MEQANGEERMTMVTLLATSCSLFARDLAPSRGPPGEAAVRYRSDFRQRIQLRSKIINCRLCNGPDAGGRQGLIAHLIDRRCHQDDHFDECASSVRRKLLHACAEIV